jgi:hypothetical protein
MSFDSTCNERLARLEQEFRRARTATPELMSTLITQACLRFAAHGAAAKAAVNRLIESGAWTDAALALVELELPQWKFRRIVRENGEWHCSLSRQPQLPFGLDDIAEASHENLALAILIAFLEVRCAAAVNAAGRTAVPQVRSEPISALCCDNLRAQANDMGFSGQCIAANADDPWTLLVIFEPPGLTALRRFSGPKNERTLTARWR